MSVTTNHYHLLVLGSDIAGLVAAAHAAQRGKRVLVIPIEPILGEYRLGQEAFPLDSAPLVHLETPAVRRSYQELGLWGHLRRELDVACPLQHWVMDGHRLDMEPQMANFTTECTREWPDDPVQGAWQHRAELVASTAEALDEILSSDGALIRDRFWARRFLDRAATALPAPDLDELSPLAANHDLRAQVRCIEPWLLGLSPRQLGKAASLRLAGMWNRGPLDRKGGMRGLRAQLVGRIQLKSGEIKPDLRVAEILLKRGKVVGVNLLGKRDRYGCDHMLIAENPSLLVGGPLVNEQIPRPLAKTLDGIRVVARRFVLHLKVGPTGLSPALDGIAVCRPDREDSSDAVGTTYIRTDPVQSDGSRRVAITRIVGVDEPLDSMREQMLDELDQRGVLPFVRPHLRLVHSPHDGREATDGEGQPLSAVASGSAMKLGMGGLYESQAAPALGIGLLPHSSGIKHLYFASHLSLPGLGLEGEFMAGLAAANLVAPPTRSSVGRSLFMGKG